MAVSWVVVHEVYLDVKLDVPQGMMEKQTNKGYSECRYLPHGSLEVPRWFYACNPPLSLVRIPERYRCMPYTYILSSSDF